ncbi:MAG TPA: amidohydrolase family protein [Candidatus Polarisedimenticolaceae bacterium]|nr:amidohydrolase family protein [Candidatus Polarisedimenticolaceae bacterium]
MTRTSIALSLAVLLFAASARAQVTVLTRATVIDGSGAGPQKDTTIVLENGRIREIAPASKLSNPDGAIVVDLDGRFIVPGIINAHGHVGAKTEPQLRQYALYGVTTATSMQTDPDEVVQVREAQKRGELRGARVSTVKYRFAPDPAVATPQQARAKVDEVIAAGADYIKVWVDGGFGTRAKLTPEFCAAVLDQARKHGKLTFGHAYELSDAKMLVERGLNVLAHNIRDREVNAETISLLIQHNVTLIPTLIRDEFLFAYGDAPAWIDDPFFLKFVPLERLKVLKTKIRDEQAKHPQRALFKAGFEMNKTNLKRLSDAGVRIALGTDSGGAADRFFIQGYSEHREMELMVQSGLSPMQVIQSFSKGGSEALGIEKEFGTLARGKAADLLVLERNPLDNIANMRSIQTIYLGGKKFD